MNIMQEMAKAQEEIDASWRKIKHIINKAKMEKIDEGKTVMVINGGKERFIWTRHGMPDVVVYFSKPEDEQAWLLVGDSKSNGMSRFFREDVDPFESMSKNSAHSFTEGSEFENNSLDPKFSVRPSIDDQIAFLHLKPKTPMNGVIIDNLRAIKRWNETPVYNGEIDVAKVLSGLVKVLRGRDDAEDQEIDWHIKKGETAIEMINRFKEEREAGMSPRDKTPDWVKKFAFKFTTKPFAPAEVAELNYIPMPERAELVHEIASMIPCNSTDTKMGSIPDNVRIANAIIFAIESMDELKREHGK